MIEAENAVKTATSRKQRLFEYLAKHPRNISAAAASVGITRSAAKKLIAENLEIYQDTFDAYLDNMEEAVFADSLGLPCPIEGMKPKIAEAAKILEIFRGEEWGRSKTKRGPSRVVKPTGQGRKMLAGRRKDNG